MIKSQNDYEAHSVQAAIAKVSGISEDPTLRHPVKNLLADWYGRLMIGLIVIILTSISIIGIQSWRETDKWTPLSPYTLQVVLNETSTVKIADGTTTGLPVVYLDQLVITRGSKCNTSNQPVAVRGTKVWVGVQPPGALLNQIKGGAIRPPGCNQYSFKNNVPQAVVDYAHKIGKPTIWQLHGEECPYATQTGVDADGNPILKNKGEGVCRQWNTANFILMPTARPEN